MHEDRAIQGLRYVADHISVTSVEFAQVQRSPMLLDGLRSRGWVNERDGRVALSERGERALDDHATEHG